MSDTVWIVDAPAASAALTRAVAKLPIAVDGVADLAFRAWPPESASPEAAAVGAGDIFLINADTPAGLAAASDLRRRCCRAPIVLMSFRHGRLEEDPVEEEADETIEVRFRCGGAVLPWFAPLYDQFIRLPISGAAALVPALTTARARRGKRGSLVDAALRRAQAVFFDESGSRADHQWKNFQQALRFLRGAQCARRIHPDDARAVLHAMKAGVSAARARDPAWEKAFNDQDARWQEYHNALEDVGFQPPLYSAYERPYRLLLIDDQQETLGWRVLLERILAPDGFTVCGDDGTGFEQKITSGESYDVILLDLALDNLQGMYPGKPVGFEGYGVFEQLQRIAPDVPVILFTATERLSVERQRQQLGVVGYLVKSEEAETQDALGYYNRLRRYCRDAIEHRLRLLLRRMVRGLQDLDPALWPKVRPYLEPALAESHRPLATCHGIGLAFEAALVHVDSAPKNLRARADRFTLRRGEPYGCWARFLVDHRNAASHPLMGADELNETDGRIVSLAASAILFRIPNSEGCLLDHFPGEASAFQRLLILDIARQSQQILCVVKKRYPADDLIASLEGIQGSLYRASMGNAITDDLQEALNGSLVALNAIAAYCAGLLPVPRPVPPWTMTESFIDAERSGNFHCHLPLPNEPLPGELECLDCFGLGGRPVIDETTRTVSGTLADTTKIGVFCIQATRSDGGKTNKHYCTVMPHNHTLNPLTEFIRALRASEGEEGSMIPTAYLASGVMALLDCSALTRSPRSAENALLILLSRTRVLDWIVSAFLAIPHATVETRQDVSQVRSASRITIPDGNDDRRRRPEIERAGVQRLADAAKDFLLTEHDGIAQRVSEQVARLATSRSEHNELIKKMQVCEFSHDVAGDEVGNPNRVIADIRERIATKDNEIRAIQGEWSRLKFLRDVHENRKELLGTDPHLLYAVVAELAPETLAEFTLVRQCLREWIWTDERSELPTLVEELIARWSAAATTASAAAAPPDAQGAAPSR